MANPHDIKVGQKVILLRIGHAKVYQSEQFDECNMIEGIVTSIGRLYFTVEHSKSSREDCQWSSIDSFHLISLEQHDNSHGKRFKCFLNKETTEKLKQRNVNFKLVSEFLYSYRYLSANTTDEELELWLEFIEKVEALKNI